MPMIMIVGAILLSVMIFGPQIWARRVFRQYRQPFAFIPGTGGEFAQHLIGRLQLDGVSLEEGERHEDYYDPDRKLVKLAGENFHGKTLTAITIAVHEIGHAMQHKLGYRPLQLRTGLVKIAQRAEKIAAAMLVAAPFLSLITRVPAISVIVIMVGIGVLAIPVLVHFSTLPVEWDASFKRALPILIAGEYLPESHLPIAKKILTAAALTYVAASLASILNFYRWLVFLRR